MGAFKARIRGFAVMLDKMEIKVALGKNGMVGGGQTERRTCVASTSLVGSRLSFLPGNEIGA